MECAICGLPANQENWYAAFDVTRGDMLAGEDPDTVKNMRERGRWFFCGDHWPPRFFAVLNEETGLQDLLYEGRVYASM